MTTAQANGQATGLFDLDAAENAAAATAEGSSFRFTYHGAEYEVPPTTQWPLAAFRDITNGDLEAALGKLLGAEVFTQLADAGLKVGGMNVLFEEIARGSGLTLPNSQPPRRLASPPRPKRR